MKAKEGVGVVGLVSGNEGDDDEGGDDEGDGDEGDDDEGDGERSSLFVPETMT